MSHIAYATRRRLSAIGALAAVAFGLLTLIGTLSRSPVAFLVAAAALLAAIGFGWLTLIRVGRDRTVAAMIAVTLLILALIAVVVARSPVWTVLLAAVSFGVALPLGRYALGHDRKTLQDGTEPGVEVPPAMKPVLLVNPKSGDGKAEQIGLVQKARDRGIETHTFGPDRDLRDLTQEVLASGADVIGIAGGDGSLAIVADLVRASGTPIVVIPSGTRNHFAMDLGLDRSNPLAALDAFGEARLKVVDVARVNDTLFLNNVSMGIYGEVVQQASYRERKLGTTVSELPSLVAEPPQLRFTDADGQQRSTAHVVMVSNNPYLLKVRGGGGRPRLNTGELGVMAAELGSASEVTEMIARAALGSIASAPGFTVWTDTRFTVSSDGVIAAGVDGEAFELQSPAVFEILPGALQVRIPTTAIGYSPAALVPGAGEAFAELFRRAFLPVGSWQPLPSQ